MKNQILSWMAIGLLFLSFNAQANDAKEKKNNTSENIVTLVGAGLTIAAVQTVSSHTELSAVIPATAHLSTLFFAAGRLTKDDTWKKHALKLPLAVATVMATASDFVQSGNNYIPFFNDALKEMPKEVLVGVESIVFYIYGTNYVYKMKKKDIYKTLGWQIDAQED